MRSYKLSSKAFSDLDEIWAYIARDNITAANNLLKNFYKKFDLISEFNEIGHRRSDLTEHDIRFVSIGNYVIIYMIRENHIEVLRVLSSFRDIFEEL